MLAYSPVHHLLFDALGALPLVMTSANQGGSPIVFRDADLSWIDGLADAVLGHDRPIHVPCEDSVRSSWTTAGSRCRCGGPAATRRCRCGCRLPDGRPRSSWPPAVTPKTTFCLMGRAVDGTGQAHLSSHLGDMSDPRTQACFTGALDYLAFMTDRRPAVIACDRHPGYATTRWAERHADGRPVVAVQHHHAHAVSLLAERGRLGTPMLAVACDGTGYGTDERIWGGELLAVDDPATFTRAGHLAPFTLPGGDGAVRQPARIALDLLRRAGIAWEPDLPPVGAVGPPGLHVLAQQIPRGPGACRPPAWAGCSTRSPACSACASRSATRASCRRTRASRPPCGSPAELDFAVSATVMDPIPVIAGIVEGLRTGADPADLAAGSIRRW